MPKLTVNGKEVEFEQGMTVLQAVELAEVEVPRFCYHERLKIAGNCRMCLVQIEGGPPKPAASCAMPAGDGMVVHTNTPMVKKAREGVMEFLLINHPLDCPICDQGGECDLQDQAMTYGRATDRFDENKRAVKDKYMGPVIKTQMTRCIHCTRCVRFMDDVAGVSELGAVNRGEHTEISTFIEQGLSSELSGNIVDLCPVGALTSKPYAFRARPWELIKTESIDISDAVGSNIRIDAVGNEVVRVMPRLNEEINEEWISDKTRFIFEGLKYQRLDKPYVRKGGKLQPVSWGEAIKVVSDNLSSNKPEAIAAIAGDLADAESVFSLKSLLDDMAVKSYDCRQDGAMYDASLRASYIFNSGIESVEESDCILIVGSNPRYEAPLVNARIRKAIVEFGAEVSLIGDEVDLTYNYNYLGKKISFIDDLIKGKGDFAKKLKSSKKPMIIVGNDIFKRRDAEIFMSKLVELSKKYNVISKDWNGLNILQKAASRVGALDLGFVPQKGGRSIDKILKACESGDIETIFLLGADELDEKSLKKPFVIYQGSHGDRGAAVADVILPATAYTEKSATYVNLEGRVQRTRRAAFPLGEAKEDWEIISLIASEMKNRSFESIEDVREKMEEYNEVFVCVDEQNPASWDDYKESVKTELSKSDIETVLFNFYKTDPISRLSNTLNKCDEEFGEKKGFLDSSKGKKKKVA